MSTLIDKDSFYNIFFTADNMQGQLTKMAGRLIDNQVHYQLTLADQQLDMNALLEHKLKLTHNHTILCTACRRITSKSFNQGYCYPCFTKLAQCDLCIMKPETCHYAQGTCREPDWGKAFCFQSHIVYLANSSGIKVGITRQTQIPTRWIDQGATQALPILKTVSRYVAGLVEVVIAKHISDKTSWQKMLKSQAEAVDLQAQRDHLLAICAKELEGIQTRFGEDAFESLAAEQSIDLVFPIAQYPDKVKSLCLSKTPEICGTLLGIKGQYLLLDSGVINLRKYTGYTVNFESD